jgi:hypothetical protein
MLKRVLAARGCAHLPMFPWPGKGRRRFLFATIRSPPPPPPRKARLLFTARFINLGNYAYLKISTCCCFLNKLLRA